MISTFTKGSINTIILIPKNISSARMEEVISEALGKELDENYTCKIKIITFNDEMNNVGATIEFKITKK